MDCVNGLINYTIGVRVIEANKPFQEWINPNTLLANKHGVACKPGFDLGIQVDTLKAPWPEVRNWRRTEDMVDPCGSNCNPGFSFGVQMDSLEAHVPEDTHGKNTEERMWETMSIDQAFTSLEMSATQPSLDNLICVLQKCREKKDLACAKRAYFHACHNGLEAHTVLGNYLVPMFVDCGCLSEGRQVFDRLAKRNEHSWTSLIQGCIEWGESQHAFDLFERMDYDSIQPSRFTFVALLKACARVKDMERGRELHAEITKQGCETDSFVGNILVDMYAKCGSLAEAQLVFNKLPVQDEVSWNTLIAGYADHGRGEEALKRLEQMQLDGMSPNAVTFICGLKASGTTGALEKGQGIHAELAREGYESAFNVGSALVDMYAKCGSLVEARDVFDNLRGRDAISWNPLIIGYAEQGFGKEALDCLEEMKLEGVSPDAVALAGCIKACGSIGAINKAQEIHAESAKQGFERDPFICSSLVDMYAKFGSVVEAQEVFNKLSFRGVVPWTALIAGYTDHGLGQEALNCLGQMHLEGVPPNDITLVCSLKACGCIGAVEKGKELHIEIAKEGFEKDPFIGSALVDMYAKCGSLAEAQESLVGLPVRGVVAWTALIAGYAEEGLGEEAFYSLKQMQAEGVFPNAVTFACILKACGSLAAIHRGQELYASIVVEGFEQQPFVGSLLVDMYVKCGSLAEAREVFDKLPSRDVAAWNALIAGYAEHGFCEEALNSFEQMQLEGMSPNAITFVWALKACGILQAIGRGQEFVIQIAKEGLDKDPFICNTLVDLYAKCGFLIDAQDAFDKLPVRDVVSWTSLIAGYAEYGFGKEALNCSIQMKSEGLLPDAGTFVCCLKACGSVGAIDRGREIHTEICAEGFETDFLVGNTLVDMYAKCGLLLEAQEVFDELQIQDVVSWTALIGGYAEHGHEKEALNCFQHMQLKGVSPDVVSWNNVILGYAQQGWSEKAFELYAQMQEQCLLPNKVTLTNNLKACGTTAALKIGKKIVTQIYAGSRVELIEVVLANAVVDMYGRCGSMVDAQQAFDAMPTRQLVTWNGLITGYARQGESEVIFHLLARMREEGIWPNEITLLCVLIACNHAGLIDRGKKYFEAMSTEYRIDRSIMHYNCMIDLLGRAGRLDEIVILLQEMPFQPNHVTWTTVLSASQKWGNIELGRHAFESLVRLDGRNISAFVLMSNIYANAHMWDEVKKIESMRVYLGVSQESGKSWIEVGEAVHAIVSGDTKPCKRKESNVKRKHISIELEGFCLPNFSRFLQDTDDDAKGEALCVYTQKRTNAQGLISAPECAPIRIVKNLWVCDDCHVAMALLSKAEKRTIACRDAGRTHVFKDGKCSCMNYS